MKKTFYAIVACSFLIAAGCSRDYVPSIDDIKTPEKPTKPTDPTGPTNPTDPTGPTEPTNPGEVKPGKTLAFPGADFENWDTFLGTLQDYQGTKIKDYATQAIGQGWENKNGLKLVGTPTGNDYVFTVENVKNIPVGAAQLSFLVKGTADKTLVPLIYKGDGKSYYAYNVGDLSTSKTIVADTKPQTSDANSTTPNYTGKIDTKGQWVKVVLDLKSATAGYNTGATGKTFSLKVGKDAAYNLIVDEIRFEDGNGNPTGPTDPTGPTTPTDPTGPTNPGDFNIPANQKAYYTGVNLKLTGIALKEELADLVTKTHKRILNYSQVQQAIIITDAADNNNLYAIYGTKGTTSGKYAYTIGKSKDGSSGDNVWNREHVFAKSLGDGNLGTSGPGADGHHLRASVASLNSDRGNLLFSSGSGMVAKKSGSGWYPGDEWKGDVARMMMYMYLRYNKQCYPTRVAIGSTNNVDSNMVNLLLEWNAQDPVSEVERQRNEYLGNASNQYGQGNRNPFIDNPYLATQIWGGPVATNLWK
ncbi:MAG: endonuclease [Flavobacteriaceae bacterium]|jgi:endonuclease I|nr:endonuclease [Flavobacteriaceae bacterium]